MFHCPRSCQWPAADLLQAVLLWGQGGTDAHTTHYDTGHIRLEMEEGHKRTGTVGLKYKDWDLTAETK